MNTLDIICIVVVSGSCGFILSNMIMAYKIRRIIKMLAVQLNEPSNTKSVEVPNMFTEMYENSIMLYDKTTNNFVCQAKSLEELAQNLLEFKQIKRAVVNHADEQLLFVEGKIEKHLKE